MDFEDLFSSKPEDPLALAVKQDLGPLSLDELAARIETLRAEILRIERHLAEAASHRASADDIFKRP